MTYYRDFKYFMPYLCCIPLFDLSIYPLHTIDKDC